MNNTHVRTISSRLVKAYRQADYVINLPDQLITLKIGQFNKCLANLMADESVTTAAFLTAFNPYSQELGEGENEAAQRELIADLRALHVSIIFAQGNDSNGHWPGEPSLFALGISIQDAEMLADRYMQNGFVWIGNSDAIPNLRLRYPIEVPSKHAAQEWIKTLPTQLRAGASQMPLAELAWMMAVPDEELTHWLNISSWDLGVPWPLARPDGSAMGVGTELDRVFKLISAGIQRFS